MVLVVMVIMLVIIMMLVTIKYDCVAVKHNLFILCEICISSELLLVQNARLGLHRLFCCTAVMVESGIK